MDTQAVDRTREYVRAMIGKKGIVNTRNYLTSEMVGKNFRKELVDAGVLVGGKINFSILPIRKSDMFTSACIQETYHIVSNLIQRDGIDYTIADLTKEPSEQIKQKLVEAGLMLVTSEGKFVVNVSGVYYLSILTEKSSNTGSIQPIKSQGSPL